MNEFSMTIAGRSVKGESPFPVINPATGAPFADAPECTLPQLDHAMEAAQEAFGSWSRDEQKRRQALHECARILRASTDALADILTREQGKPLQSAREELTDAASFLEAVAGWTIQQEVLKDDEKVRIEMRRKPFGSRWESSPGISRSSWHAGSSGKNSWQATPWS